MKVLLMSLAVSNRGDEAIGRAMIEALVNTETVDEITILYNEPTRIEDKITLLRNYPHVKINHKSCGKLNFWERKIIYLTFILPFTISRLLIKTSASLTKEIDSILNADRVINAPGGIDIGPYKSWGMLWRLFVAKKLLKPVAFYARSYGPLPAADSIKNLLFQKTAKTTLSKLDYISLRDTGSQNYASLDGIVYTPTIDCVFLDKNIASPTDSRIIQMRDKNEYVVITLNDLSQWHPWYNKNKKNSFDKLYVEIITFFTSKKVKVFLLPHLYSKYNDKQYCEYIMSLCYNVNTIECLPDTYDSYTQQYIIQNASFLVSSRFHSIVFAIKNNTPFLALSYEHKTIETLQILLLQEYSINLQSFFEKNTDAYSKQKCLSHKLDNLFTDRIHNKKRIKVANNMAFDIASKTFHNFANSFLKH